MNDKCCNCACCKSKLGICSLGLALGIAQGLCLMVMALSGLYFGLGIPMIENVASVYYGFAPSVVGAFYGLLWGFLHGFIFGVVVAAVYNCCLHCARCCKDSKGVCTCKGVCVCKKDETPVRPI